MQFVLKQPYTNDTTFVMNLEEVMLSGLLGEGTLKRVVGLSFLKAYLRAVIELINEHGKE